jgi:hypothetical protein
MNDNSQKEIIHILEIVMEQNCLQFEQKFCKHTDGLAVGAPASGLISEGYVQNMEHKHTSKTPNIRILSIY